MKAIACFSLLMVFLCLCSTKTDYFTEVERAIQKEQYDMALTLATDEFNGAISRDDSITSTEALYHISRIHALSGKFDKALENAKEAQSHAMSYQLTELEYKINNLISWSYFELGHGMKDSFDHQKRQLQVVEKLNDNEKKALVFNNYSYDGTVSGYVPLSKAISMMRFANSFYAEREDNNGRWYTLMNLTWQYRLANQLPKSLEYGVSAFEQAKKEENRHAIVETAAHLGETLIAMNKLQDAARVYNTGLDWASQEEGDRDYHVFQIYYSRYLWDTGQKANAMNGLKIAIEYLSSGEVYYEMLARAFYASYLYQTGNYEKATQQLSYFDNPRGGYYSQEAEVIASVVKAKLISEKKPEKAIKLLQNHISDVERSEASQLKNLLSKEIIGI